MTPFRHAAAIAFVAFPTAAISDPGQSPLKLGPIACDSRHHLYNILNAAGRRDTVRVAHYEASACESLGSQPYEIVREMNGVSEIRIFATKGDWASSHVGYTLDEMLTPSG